MALYADDYFSDMRRIGSDALKSAQRAAARARVAAEVVLAGPVAPAPAIVRVAERRRCDLIVMASHGRGGLQRVVLGSVTEGVLRRTRRPLLVIRCTARRRTTRKRRR
jgi:nucleotide-binding universal stress UspA family protein